MSTYKRWQHLKGKSFVLDDESMLGKHAREERVHTLFCLLTALKGFLSQMSLEL